MLGIWTRGSRMVGTDESTELWQLLMKDKIQIYLTMGQIWTWISNKRAPYGIRKQSYSCPERIRLALMFAKTFNSSGDIAKNIIPSVTRWLEYFFNIWPFTTMNICPIPWKMAKVASKLRQIWKKHSKIAKDFKMLAKYGRTGGGSSGLVVIGGESCSRGRQFKSQLRTLMVLL